MKAAIICGGSSVLEHDFSVRNHDVIVAVNHMGERVHYDHWAALDSHMAAFQAMCPDHALIDWDFRQLRSGRELQIKQGVRYTFPYALAKLQDDYEPDEIHVYGVDMTGERVDGIEAKPNRWKDEEAQLLQLDLSRCIWHGIWKPPEETNL